MVSEKLGAAFIEIGVDTGGLTTGLAGAKAQVTGFGASASSAFAGLASSINPVTIAIAGATAGVVALSAAFVGSVRSAAQWQTLMVDVQKVTDTTASEFATLSKELLAIRGETGASMADITGAAAGAGRMGIDASEIADYTNVVLKMSSAWGMSADAASDSIGKIGSVVKPAEMSWTEFGNRMGSTINDLADSMATSEESIVTGMKKVSAQMAMLKPDPSQLSAWAALVGQLQAFGMTAETSGESLKDSLNYMMRDDKGGISSMLDMDTTEFQEAIREDAIGTIQELAVAISELPIDEQGQALQKFGATGGQMMGMLVGKVDPVTKEIEGLNAALATGAGAWENASSLNEAYAKSQETLNAQIEIFKGKISVAATSIGTVLLPFLTDMMGDINGITQALMDLGAKGWKWLYGGVDDEGAETKGAIGRLTGWLDEKLGIEYGAKLGEEMGEAAAPEVAEGVQAGLESVDGKGAGEKVGKAFGDAVAEMTKAGVSREIASMYALGASGDLAALEMWNQYSGREQSGYRYGEMFSAGGSDIVFGYNKSKGSPYLLSVGNVQKGFGSYAAAEEWLRTEYPMVYAAMDPRQLDVAMRTARSSTYFDDDAVVVQLKAELAGGKSAWDLFAEELAPTQAQIAEIQAAYESAFQEAMGGGAFVGDMKTAMEDLGKTGAKAFSDGWISGTEAAEMVAEYSRLKVFDPERYTELGGDGAVAFWEGAKEKLETLAALEAAGQLGTIEYKDALEDLSQHLNDPANTVYVRGKLDVGVSPEVSAFREALLWEDWGGSDAEIGLWKYRDDLVDLHYAVETATEYQGDLARAFDIVTNAGKHENQVVEEAINLLHLYTDIPLSSIRGIADYYKSITDEVGKSKKEIKNWGEQVDASLACACGAMSDFAKWQEDPKNQMFQPSGIMNSKKYFEEILANPDQYRPGQVEYAVELYAQWKIDEDAKTRLIEESGFSADEPLEISVVPVLSDSAFETAVEMPIIPTIGDGAESEIEATVNLKGREAAEAIRAAGTAFVASGRQAGDYLVTTSTTLRGQISDAGTAFREQGFAVSSKFRSDVYSAGSNFFSRVDAAAARLEDALAGVGGGGGGGFFGSSSSGGGLWSGGYSGGTIAPRSGWMDAGGIVYSPTIVGVGEKRPEAIAPLADLLPMIQQAVASAGGSSGPIHIGEINVYSSGDAEEVARAVVEELRVEISNAYVNRRRG
jgi:TP901 family phage tail tape measure protein